MKKILLINLVLLLIVAGSGVFTGIEPNTVLKTNVNNQEIEMYGSGVYKNESLFRAPIYKGTDLLMILIIAPLLLILSFKKTVVGRLLNLGVICVILYYSASLAFGAAYNNLFLAYILLFSLNMFLFISEFIKVYKLIDRVPETYPKRFNMIFLFIAGCSVFVWLIEIINSIATGMPPELIGMSSTEVTFVIDLAIIAPSAFICVFLIKRNNVLGIVGGISLTILNFFIGIIVVFQTAAQSYYNVSLKNYEIIAFMLPFLLMSIVAFILIRKNLKAVDML